VPQRERTVSRRRCRTAGALLATCSLLLQGCYESLPLQQGVAPSTARVEFQLNDAGRIALGDKLGANVLKVEGTVLQQDNSSYQMSVFRVTHFDGSSAAWTGERVSVAKEHTVGYSVRRLNKVRTALLVGGVVVGIAAIFAKSLGLVGGSDPGPGDTGPPPPSRSRARSGHTQ